MSLFSPPPPGFVSPPENAYQILVRKQNWKWNDGSEVWGVVDIQMFGRSLYTDFNKILGGMYPYRWPSQSASREAALAEGKKLVTTHRQHCYTIETS